MSGTQLLLLVEDEALIQALLEDALTDAGYELVITSDGHDAMRELESDSGRFGGIITDIRLGSGPDGWAIGHRARELSPDIPIVYMSGDSGHEWTSKGVPHSAMVQKPFAVAQIVTAISALMVQADSRTGAVQM